jgi:23S rRNA C2498 (ribose-2'-O)-methylase RlmM
VVRGDKKCRRRLIEMIKKWFKKNGWCKMNILNLKYIIIYYIFILYIYIV